MIRPKKNESFTFSNTLISTLIVFISLFINYSALANSTPVITEVRYNQNHLYSSNEVDDYYELLLTLALEATVKEYGEYKLLPQSIQMVQQRSTRLLQNSSHIDVIWTMTSKDREERLQAVYIPLLKGLLGYRLFLIRKDEQHLFNHIQTAEQLKKLSIGQGISWPDTKILELNSFSVVKALGNNLHDMLENKRFDLFPRSILEITNENISRPNLTIESNLLLKYPAPLYFFVNKDNQKLAKRLTVGLNRIIENGKFDEIFYSSKGPIKRMREQRLDERTVIEINNPNLTKASERLINNHSLWFLQNAELNDIELE
jgi:hypothetical protein